MSQSQKTDYTRWRMLDEDGKHTWHYLDDDEVVAKWPQTLADKYYLGLPLVVTCTMIPYHSLAQI